MTRGLAAAAATAAVILLSGCGSDSSQATAAPASEGAAEPPASEATGPPSSTAPSGEDSSQGWTLSYDTTSNGETSAVVLVLADPTHYALYLDGKPSVSQSGSTATVCDSGCQA